MFKKLHLKIPGVHAYIKGPDKSCSHKYFTKFNPSFLNLFKPLIYLFLFRGMPNTIYEMMQKETERSW